MSPPPCHRRDKGGGDATCLLQVWGKWGKPSPLPHLQEKQVEGDWGGTCLHPHPPPSSRAPPAPQGPLVLVGQGCAGHHDPAGL